MSHRSLVFFSYFFLEFTEKYRQTLQAAQGKCTHPTTGAIFSGPNQPAIATKTVTVVTAYYDVPSKWPRSVYIAYMGNFLPNIPCSLCVFTNRADRPVLRELRKPHLHNTKFVIREFSELLEARRMEVWREQTEMDHENCYESPELYVVWQEKIHIVMEAIEENAFHSEFFIWCVRVFPEAGFVARFTDSPGL